MSAAEGSGMISTVNVTQKNTRKQRMKPWFNTVCREKRQNYLHAKHRFRRVKSQTSYNELVSHSKIDKKQINKQFREYHNSIANKLRNLRHSDPKSYWNMLNKFSGERKEVLKKVSAEVFYEHFSKLNSHETEDDLIAFDLQNVSDSNTDLNCPITTAVGL